MGADQSCLSRLESTLLSQQRCYHHKKREAVVRCPDCGRFFCRECVTEHHQRMLCSMCLQHITRGREKKSKAWVQSFFWLGQGGIGFVLIWYAFYLMGLFLLKIPHTFHEGTIWQMDWWGVR